MYTRKSWQEKLHTGRLPKLVVTSSKIADVDAGKKLLIPTPLLIDAYIRRIPKGQTTDIATMRKDLALEYGADATCPLTTGIFIRIVAEAAYEAFTKGEPLKNITPFWRAIGPHAPVARKLSFGTDWLNKQRRKEKIKEVV